MSRIDRRALFASGAAAALLAATGMSAEASPRRGGTLRLAVPREGGMLDLLARRSVFETLTEIGPDGALRGELASAWHGSADGTVWQFDLRDDAMFHDGKLVTPEDVVHSLQALPGVLEFDTGKDRVTVVQAPGNPDLPIVLADAAYSIAPVGKAGAPLSEAVGSGYFRVDRAQEGRHFRASRIAQTGDATGKPWLDAIEAIVIPDADVRAEALKDGFVDVAALPTASGLHQQDGLRFHPSVQDMALAASREVGLPQRIGTGAPLDDGRIAERWWMLA